MGKFLLGFFAGFVVMGLLTVAVLSERVSNLRSHNVEAEKPEPTTTPAPAIENTPSLEKPEKPPVILEEDSNKLLVQVEREVVIDDVTVAVKQVRVTPGVVTIKIKLENSTGVTHAFYLYSSSITINEKQLDFDSQTGSLSGDMQPGVVKEGDSSYAISSTTLLMDISKIDAIQLHLGYAPNAVTIDLPLRQSAKNRH